MVTTGAIVLEPDAVRVRDALRRLRKAQPDVLGANSHRFQLSAPAPDADVLNFERRYGIRLPEDYRHFLTTIGNGGAGPFYGIFPLGQMDGDFDGLQPWGEDDGLVGVLSEPFPIESEWNDLSCKPREDLYESDVAEYDRKVEEFEKKYWHSANVNGAIPICHEGCALRDWLVLTGNQAGRLWHDGRSDYTGLKPLKLADDSPATFSLWYNEWLDCALAAI